MDGTYAQSSQATRVEQTLWQTLPTNNLGGAGIAQKLLTANASTLQSLAFTVQYNIANASNSYAVTNALLVAGG